MTIHGTPIFIKEVANSGKGTGLTVWDAVSSALATLVV